MSELNKENLIRLVEQSTIDMFEESYIPSVNTINTVIRFSFGEYVIVHRESLKGMESLTLEVNGGYTKSLHYPYFKGLGDAIKERYRGLKAGRDSELYDDINSFVLDALS